MKIVLISPHRDDAAFSLGLAIGSWLEAGHKVNVLNCFTRSEYAPYSEVELLHPNDRMPRISAIRLREDEAWQRMYGAGLSLSDLNLKDAPLRRQTSIDRVCNLPVDPSDKAILKTQKAVNREDPDALLLPLALGSHVDHLTVRDALSSATGSPLPVAFYEDLPYAARAEVTPAIEGTAQAIHPGLTPAFAVPAAEAEAAMLRKRRLALCYDSQIDSDVVEQIAAFSARYAGRERLWVNAAWKGSPLFLAEAEPEGKSA